MHAFLLAPYGRLGAAGAVMLLALLAAPTVGAEEVRVARYSSLRIAPTAAQVDPLAATVTLSFPASVTQVGQAVEALLRGSGYRLAGQAAASPERAALLVLPLPDVHRLLGPLPLRSALATLAGPAFIVIEDPLHRLVSFERCNSK